MRKTVLICLMLSMVMSLSGCVVNDSPVIGSTSMLTANNETFLKLASMVITPESQEEYQLALKEQERRGHYIDLEHQYHDAYLKYYNDFSEAYNLGIIDEKGIPTGTMNTSFDSYTVEQYDVNSLRLEAEKCPDKESLLVWLNSLKFLTEGPELLGEDNDKYLDVMLSEFEISPSVFIGFTKESLELVTKEEIIDWLCNFYNIEKKNVELYRERVAKMSAEELALRVSQLLAQDFTNPTIDDRISILDNRHVLTENTVKMFSSSTSTLDLKLFNTIYTVDLTSLGRKPVYGKTYNCQFIDDGKKIEVKLVIDGVEKIFNLPIEKSTNKIILSKYDVYKLLGMEVYV